MHIGLIGGIGPAATVFYYERIERAFASAGEPLHLTICHTSAVAVSRNVAAGRVTEQATEFIRIANQLAAAGADTVAITSMGAHFCAKDFEPQSPLPLTDGPTAVAGRTSPEQRERLLAASDSLVRDQGADAVLLGGTDLNLVFDGTGFDHPVIDSAAAHADAIVAQART
ncbi:MAG: hypothetical protein HKN60_10835, partial [Rhizobiales bacterium]|nr:hypothetical protein [Hyphomicrobiales bacterium]